jgi:hypothetical protein
MAKNLSVLGIYPDRTTVSDAISVLRKAGYRSADIAVFSAENQGSKDFAHEKGSKAPEGAAAGAAGGAIAGALLGWLVATGVIAIPGLEPLTAVRPVMAALAAAACSGALGWLIGLFIGLSVPEYVAKRYAGRMGRAGILLSVHCDSSEWCERAKKSLKDTGARYISSASESAADYATTDKPTPRPTVVVGRDEVHEGRTSSEIQTTIENESSTPTADGPPHRTPVL